MRLFAAFLLVLSLFTSAFSPVYAQTKRPVSGVVAASSGDVQISYTSDDGDDIGRIADIGDPIYLNDVIRTGPETKLQVLLKDQTVFTIGPNAELVFDEFVYDPSGEVEPVLSATVKKGVFKFISGKVSAQKPGAMTLNLPNSTASIRGTTVAGRVAENGDTDLVLLTGAISVASIAQPEPVDVFQSGWGVTVSPEGLVDDPFPVPIEVLNEILTVATIQLDELNLPGTDGIEAGEGAEQELSPEQQLIVEFTELATEALAAEGETEVSVNALLSLIAGDEDLAALFLANGLDVETVPDINYAYLDTALLTILAGGGGPVYFRLQDNGDGTYSADHTSLSATESTLLEGPYSGSVRFTSSGLEFAPRADATSASGTLSYDYIFNLDRASMTGSFSVNDVVIDGNNYGSGSTSFSDEGLQGKDQAGYGTDTDMVMNVGDEIFEVKAASLSLSNAGNEATAELNVSFGSAIDGVPEHTINGMYASTNVMIFDDSDSSIRSRAEKYEVGRKVD